MLPLSQKVNDRAYMKIARKMRPTVASIRRRALVATLHRWYNDAGFGKVTGVEVGVKYGSLTKEICQWCPWIEKMICVDPWEEYPQDHRDRGQFGYAGRDQKSWNWVYKRANDILGPLIAEGRVEIQRTYSVQAASGLLAAGRQVHFAYLDARHAYDDVLEDCRAWWPVVMAGGLLCFDDYYGKPEESPLNWRRATTGVSDAADEFAREVGLPIFGLHRSAYIENPMAS